MKKILSVVGLLCAVAFSASAVPSISLNMKDDAGVWTDASISTLCNNGVTVLLVWSADSAYTTPLAGTIPSTRGSAFGSDFLLFSGTGNISGGYDIDLDGGATYTSADVGGNSILTGNVYIMLFANNAPVLGTQYVVSSMTTPLSDSSSGLLPPDDVNIAPPAGGGAYFGQPGLSGTVAAVPEPSTVGLLLVGAGLIGLRRFRRS